MIGSIGGVEGICADCSLDEVLTDFVRQQPQIQQVVTKQVDSSDSLLLTAGTTKRQFPAGQTDTLNDLILTVTVPKPSDGAGWSQVREAMPGYSPCSTTPRKITYGAFRVQSCLYQMAYSTQPFCVVDLTFKTKREEQFARLMQMLPMWTAGVNKYWYRAAFRRNVPCFILNQQDGNPNAMGEYPTYSKPTSFLGPDHMSQFYFIQKDQGANISPFTVIDTVPCQVAFIGQEEFRMMELLERKRNQGLGQRIPTVPLEKLGNVRVIDNYVYVAMDYPSRFGDAPDGSLVEIEPHIDQSVTYGDESVINPDYRNPAVAKYSETILWHAECGFWMMSPEFTGWGALEFGMQDFSGNFSFINFKTEADPKAKNGYFLAEFMNGFHPRFPRRGMCVLSLAVHLQGKDIAECYTNNSTPVEIPLVRLRDRSFAVVPNVAGGFSFLTDVNAPGACGDGKQLYLVSQDGKRAPVTITYRNEGGTYKAYVATFTDTSLAVDRPCDPWQGLACLPLTTAATALASDCLACGDNPVPGGTTPQICDYRVSMTSASILDINLGGNLLAGNAAFHFPYTVAATLDADLTAAIAALGGNPETQVIVTLVEGVWDIQVNDTTLPLRAAYGSAGNLAFSRSNCQAPPAPAEA